MSTLRVPSSYATVAAATAAAHAGDTILIASGYAGQETVYPVVNDLIFSAPASVVGIEIDAFGVTAVTLAGSAPFTLRGGGGSGAIHFVGNEGDNSILLNGGGSGPIYIDGGGGNDYIDGGTGGVDTLLGGSGNDTFQIDGYDHKGSIDGGTGVDKILAYDLGTLVIKNVEVLDTSFTIATLRQLASFQILDSYGTLEIGFRLQGAGGSFDFSKHLAASHYVDVDDGGLTSAVKLTGTSFADTLGGSEFDDTLAGGGGADELAGGAGNDMYVVTDLGTLVREAANGGHDTVRSSVNFTLPSNVEDLTLTGRTGLVGQGNALSNVIAGTGGDDRIIGRGGADTLRGGGGNDRYTVEEAADVVFEAVGGGDDVVFASANYALATGQEIESLRADAGAVGLHLTGNEFANLLVGRDGADTLEGGLGADRLIGGAGADRYVFTSLSDSGLEAARDRIDDFSRADHDLIDVSAIQAVAGAGLDQAFTFIGDADFTHVAGQLHQATEGHFTLIEGDVNGDAKADFQVALVGSIQLSPNDFRL